MWSSAAFILIVALLLMTSQWAIERMGQLHYEHQSQTSVFDVAHKYLPDLYDYSWIVNVIPLMLFGIALVAPSGARVMRETLFMFLLVLAIRALTAVTTILPKYERCETTNGFWNIFQGGGCYDKIFSGHTALITLLTLNFYKHGIMPLGAVVGFGVANAAVMLLTRGHYTADIILGATIAYLIWDGDYSLFKRMYSDFTSGKK